MFGIWRTMLAIEVVIYHLADVPVIGEYAVFGFFVLSGFLMTAIMHATYGYSGRGFTRYLQNRALRLYPNYWFALGVSVLVITAFGSTAAAKFNPNITLPDNVRGWLENLTMIFLGWYPHAHMPRLVPPSWALTVEIFYYILIGLGVSSTRMLTLIWVVISLAYIPIAYAAGGGGGANMYSAVPAGSLPFAVGSLTFYYRTQLYHAMQQHRLTDPRLMIPLRWLSCTGFVGLNMLTGQGWLISLGNYVNVAIAALIVCGLYHARPSDGLRRADRIIGDLSYPIYLLHWQMGMVASMALTGVLARGAATAAFGLILTILVGLVCARIIDPAVERARARVRKNAVGAMGAA